MVLIPVAFGSQYHLTFLISFDMLLLDSLSSSCCLKVCHTEYSKCLKGETGLNPWP